ETSQNRLRQRSAAPLNLNNFAALPLIVRKGLILLGYDQRMDFTGGISADDDYVFMFVVAGDVDGACGASAFDARPGIDLVAVGAIDHVAHRIDVDLSVRWKRLRKRRN